MVNEISSSHILVIGIQCDINVYDTEFTFCTGQMHNHEYFHSSRTNIFACPMYHSMTIEKIKSGNCYYEFTYVWLQEDVGAQKFFSEKLPFIFCQRRSQPLTYKHGCGLPQMFVFS